VEDNLHFRSYAAALLVVGVGSMAFAQNKVTTPEELDKTMKKVGPALQATNKALASKNFAEASKQLTIMKQGIIDSREFWIQHKKDDAISANKEVVAKIEAVEKMLSDATPDGSAVAAALKQQVGSACRTCHEKYRVRDADNNWVLKPGSIGG
jgi:cytochrome c556